MAERATDTVYLANRQYAAPDNLHSRSRIYNYQTNGIDWLPWVAERIDIADDANILDIGCGPAALWSHVLPPGGRQHVTLCDLSQAMLDAARKRYKNDPRFTYVQCDANTLDTIAGQYNVITANHMVYHVHDKESLFKNVVRLQKPNGVFYATTPGENNMRELVETVKQYDVDAYQEPPAHTLFSLQNGGAQLRTTFSDVRMEALDGMLAVTDPGSVRDYLASTLRLTDDTLDAVTTYVSDIITRKKSFDITTQAGIFICKV